MHGQNCTAVCTEGYEPNEATLLCSFGLLTPADFACVIPFMRELPSRQLISSAMVSTAEELKNLLIARADANTARSAGTETALHMSVLHNKGDITTTLLTMRASANVADQRGWTPLHVAAGRGHIKAVTELISFGASALNKDAKGKLPRDVAARMAGTEALAAMQVLLAQAERSEFDQACLATGVSVTGVPCTPEPLATTQPIITTMEATNGSNLSNASYDMDMPTTMPELNTSNASNETDAVEVTTDVDAMENFSNVSNLTTMMGNVTSNYTGQLAITFTAKITVADFGNFSQALFLSQLTSSLGASAQQVRVTAVEYEISVTYAFSSGITVAEARAAIAAALNVPQSSVSVSISAARRLGAARHLAGVTVAATVKSTDVSTAKSIASLANDVAAVTAQLQLLGVNTTGAVQVMPVSNVYVITEIVVESEAASNAVQVQVTESSTLAALSTAVGGTVEVVSVTIKQVVVVTPPPTVPMTNASDVTSAAPIVDVVYTDKGNSTDENGSVELWMPPTRTDAPADENGSAEVWMPPTTSDVPADANDSVEVIMPRGDASSDATRAIEYIMEMNRSMQYGNSSGMQYGNSMHDNGSAEVELTAR